MADISERRAIISGIGISRVGRRLGVPGLDLTLEAASAALADAGLTAGDVDGLTTMGDTPAHQVAAAMDLQPVWHGGGFTTAGLLSPVMSAFRAVGEGRARHVLVYRTVEMLGGSLLPEGGGREPTPGAGGAPRRQPTRRSPPDGYAEGIMASMGDIGPLLAYHAYSAANWVAMHCRRHMHLYGTTKEHLGSLAINSRRNAALNPRAAYRRAITMDDYMAARPISEPFGLLDCDVPVDGSVALVVSAADHAADCPHPVRVEAIGGAGGHTGWEHRPDYPKMASVDAAADMWGRTDMRPADVDVAELYDGFTFLTLAWLEALGFCGDGEAGPFVADPGRIGLNGSLPLNTYGGQLSAGRMHGYWVVHEACLQLRGQAGERQVDGAEVAVASAGGGPIAGCMLLSR